MSAELDKMADEAHWNCIPSPDGVDPAQPLIDYAGKLEAEVERFKEGLRAIVRGHCGSPFYGGHECCDAAQQLLGEAEVDAIFNEPDFHWQDGAHKVRPGPKRRESVWHVLKHELEPGGYGAPGPTPTEKVIAVRSTKELAEQCLAMQAEPAEGIHFSIEEWKVDAEDV